MTTDELRYKGNDPGAVKYGNFINYYSFHSPMHRLNNLKDEMFPTPVDNTVVCLDIGCNTGDLTRQLKLHLSSVYSNKDISILGVDIDPILIERATEVNCKGVCYETMDIMNKNSIEKLRSYLANLNKQHFDIIFGFSVTMWIHLNQGDEGLLEFISTIKSIGQTLIMESQPWRCYKNACKRMKKCNSYFPLFKTLTLRENVEEVIETEILKDNKYRKVSESPPSEWNRRILSYHRIQ